MVYRKQHVYNTYTVGFESSESPGRKIQDTHILGY